jgi:hypothetical protein
MKTIRKMGHLLDAHRSNIILLLLLMTIGLYALGCDRLPKEVPASEVYSDLSAAREVPDWAPAETSPEVRYYFIPEIDVYYDAFVGEYVYYNGSIWVYSARLPQVYSDYDLHEANIVLLSVDVGSPWLRHDYYVATYPVTYFYEPHYVTYGHGWRVYDENHRHFYVSHHHKVHHNHHIHGKGKHGHGWGGGYSHGKGFKGYGGEAEGPKGRGHGWDGGGKQGHGGHDGWDNGRHGGESYREPQQPQPGKPAVKNQPYDRGKDILKEPNNKNVIKQPDVRRSPQLPSPGSGQRKVGSPPPKQQAPQHHAPKPTRQQGVPGQGQSGSNPKGSHGGKH